MAFHDREFSRQSVEDWIGRQLPDAVRTALRVLQGRLAPQGEIDETLVLFGDTPLLRTETLSRLLAERRRASAAILVSGMRPADPGPYGRLVLGPDGGLERIVEAADAAPEERAIRFVNGGIMAIDARHAVDLVDALDHDNAKGEFYLSDIVDIARRKGLGRGAIELPAAELIGINTRAELASNHALSPELMTGDGLLAAACSNRVMRCSKETPSAACNEVIPEPIKNKVTSPTTNEDTRERRI